MPMTSLFSRKQRHLPCVNFELASPSMRRFPGSRLTSAKAISTSRRRTWDGPPLFSGKEASLRVRFLVLTWECLSIVVPNAQRCSCFFGKRSPTGSRGGPTDTCPLGEGSRSSKAPSKRSRSTSFKPSSQQLAFLNNWISSWRGSFGDHHTRRKGPIGSVGTRFVAQPPKEDLEYGISKRYYEPLLSNCGGVSGSRTPFGQDICWLSIASIHRRSRMVPRVERAQLGGGS